MKSYRDKLLVNLFTAYYDARKNKRSTHSQLAYEMNYESNLISLCESLLNQTYSPGRSICFINFHPVQREVFAASFEDRIIHHLVYNYINHILERIFINDSYSCRTNKGTSYGIKRLKKATRAASNNFKEDTYVLKLDISGYFMNINKHILYEQVSNILILKQDQLEESVTLEWLLWLIKIVIFHDPTNNVIIKGSRQDWQGLPKNKSLFFAAIDTGLPIGNLTSQIFGNVYLHLMDLYIKYVLDFKYYGRYVDDFYIIHNDKAKLQASIELIDKYLHSNLNLKIHPKKIHLQNIKHGVQFLGVYIKPYRIYANKRIKKNFRKILNKESDNKDKFKIQINSFLGYLSNYNTFKLRKKVLFASESKLIFCVDANLKRCCG